jgi:hypothetical protein
MVRRIARGLIVTTFGILLFKTLANMKSIQKFVSSLPIIIFVIMALFIFYKDKFFEVFNIKDSTTRSLFTIGSGIFMFLAISQVPFIENLLVKAPLIIFIIIILIFIFIDKILGKIGIKVVEG